MKNLIELRQKWKPILMCKSTISDAEMKEYNNDIALYKKLNPNWQNEINVLSI